MVSRVGFLRTLSIIEYMFAFVRFNTSTAPYFPSSDGMLNEGSRLFNISFLTTKGVQLGVIILLCFTAYRLGLNKKLYLNWNKK